MQISKHQVCHVKTRFMQLVEKTVYQQHESEYIYMFMCYTACSFMKLKAAVTSSLPIVAK